MITNWVHTVSADKTIFMLIIIIITHSHLILNSNDDQNRYDDVRWSKLDWKF